MSLDRAKKKKKKKQRASRLGSHKTVMGHETFFLCAAVDAQAAARKNT